MNTLTPLLLVESIEPVLLFWVDQLGFEITDKVPEGDVLGFVILRKNDIEVMYQTVASVQNDVPDLAKAPLNGSFLYCKVDDLDAVDHALQDAPRVIPRRTTFYGAEELIVREPGGHTVTFAQFAAQN